MTKMGSGCDCYMIDIVCEFLKLVFKVFLLFALALNIPLNYVIQYDDILGVGVIHDKNLSLFV
jgi:hypothetical protein